MNVSLTILRARRWLLLCLLPALLAGTLGYFYTHHQAPTYQASATLYVEVAASSNNGAPGAADISNSMLLVPTYSQMINDPVIVSTVDRQLAARYPGYHLIKQDVKVAQPQSLQNTQLVTVNVIDTVPVRAADAVNAIVNIFQKRISNIEAQRFAADERNQQQQLKSAQNKIQSVTQQISNYRGDPAGLTLLRSTLAAYESTEQLLLTSNVQFKAAADAAKNAVSIYSPATVPTVPVGPHATRTALIVAAIALLLCGLAILLYDYLDDSLKTPQDVEDVVQAPVLGTVGRFNTRRLGTQLVTQKEPQATESEAYRLIRTNLQFADVDHAPHVIVITSPGPQEGKSTTASNLACVLAESGQRVSLLDADLRRPSQHKIFGVAREHGLTNALVGKVGLNGHGIEQVILPDLTLVASGPLPPRPADLLGSSQMRTYLSHVRQTADMVVLDAPPVLAGADAAILSTIADGVILVVDLEKTSRRDLQHARDAVASVGGKVLGVVINRINTRSSAYYHYHHTYRYAPETTDLTTAAIETSVEAPAGNGARLFWRQRSRS
ncbi:MAG: hypothetical protein NVSMB22_13020 [Chloroflexota bacterium]